jgi:serine/threonine-protein kinase
MNFATREPINKGWSCDKKYCATDENGTRYLLRVSDIAQYDAKRSEFDMMKQVASFGVPMCQPIEFGTCEEGVYTVLSWIDGVNAEEIISAQSDTEQYIYGLESGRILRKIHSIPAPATQEDWESRFNRKMDDKIRKYDEFPIKYENGQAFIDYINENRHLLKGRPQVYQHGDYHIGNMMIDRKGQLYIIDFNRNDYGDPWEEFNRIVWCAQRSPLFASGMVNGYFDGDVPLKFWKLLALYISSNTLSSICWAIPFGQTEVDTMLNQAREVLSWCNNMRNPIPAWYFKGYYLQYADGVPFKLKRAFDFSFLSEYGTVFKVFDGQDSGNICFGTKKDGQRYFIKFAGAPAEQYTGEPADAIARLKMTLPIYRELKHENLIELVEAKDIGGGFAMVFKWASGDCMGRMYPAAHHRFMQLPVDARLTVFHDILRFFEYIASQNYVAIDFYDGSILYDFENGKTTICDIDFFRKQPCSNDMGRMWGSSRFQSPEEYQIGATIDEVTNVYTLGATAFALFGGYNRTQDRWQLGDALFDVAIRAVNDKRSHRQQSIRQFKEEWEAALAMEKCRHSETGTHYCP